MLPAAVGEQQIRGCVSSELSLGVEGRCIEACVSFSLTDHHAVMKEAIK
jgi:hypothetical protein